MRETPARKRSLHHALWHTGWMDGHQFRKLSLHHALWHTGWMDGHQLRKLSLHHALWHTGWMDGHQFRKLSVPMIALRPVRTLYSDFHAAGSLGKWFF
ncbi:hypothetical protein AMELA_G00121810 [Ameiurus melas]|uniref:Uncharacterized protein n=1 Tax=Ameiurus melas TaxID=219545 RepID=A0A7J6ALL7_AMEME|nr:hypothetical protein AMELA_G00121810 [Ameiurus melas]